jgi:hypothetical protein
VHKRRSPSPSLQYYSRTQEKEPGNEIVSYAGVVGLGTVAKIHCFSPNSRRLFIVAAKITLCDIALSRAF